jgi:hypothetical protein
MISGNGSNPYCRDVEIMSGVTARDNRLFVDAMLYRYRAGIPWSACPNV